jgi:hypothetical protein
MKDITLYRRKRKISGSEGSVRASLWQKHAGDWVQRWEVNKAKLFEVVFIMKSRKLGRSSNAFHRNVGLYEGIFK